ncbi:MAG: alpha/beta fold hydrolase [Myxococcales bacterium]|nr:alpha/beta fold hydrolase [Myxococcales bacterium]
MRVALPGDHHLHVRVHGEGGPDVLLVHGWVVSGDVWHGVIERWPARGAGRLLAVDLRGAGWSGKPDAGYTIDDHAADLIGVIDALGLSRVVLVGHSMGGVIAQRVAVERPDALARLVLVCPVPASGQTIDAETFAFLHAQCGHHDGIAQLITPTIVGEVEPSVRDRLLVSAAATVDAALHEALDSFPNARFHERLAALTMPTMVIGGEQDPVVPLALVQAEVAGRIAGAALTVLPECGHYPMLELPAQLTALLREQVAAAIEAEPAR